MPSNPDGRSKRSGRVPGSLPKAEAHPIAPAEDVEPRLVDFAAGWFSTVLALRNVTDLPDAEALRSRMLNMKRDFERSAQQAQATSQGVEDSLVALIALLDETVMSGRGGGREPWRRDPLMQVVYGHALGGEEFYIRLERLRAHAEKNEEVLELYSFCLALGFRGRLAGTEELVQVRKQVLDQVNQLRRGGPPVLAPNFEWKDDKSDDVADRFRWWMPPAAALLAILLTWVVIKLVAMNEASAIVSTIAGAPPK